MLLNGNVSIGIILIFFFLFSLLTRFGLKIVAPSGGSGSGTSSRLKTGSGRRVWCSRWTRASTRATPPTPTGPPRSPRPSPPRASPGNSTPWWRHNPRASALPVPPEVTTRWLPLWFRTAPRRRPVRTCRHLPAPPPTCTTATSAPAASPRSGSRPRSTRPRRAGSATPGWGRWGPASPRPSPPASTHPWARAQPSCKQQTPRKTKQTVKTIENLHNNKMVDYGPPERDCWLPWFKIFWGIPRSFSKSPWVDWMCSGWTRTCTQVSSNKFTSAIDLQRLPINTGRKMAADKRCAHEHYTHFYALKTLLLIDMLVKQQTTIFNCLHCVALLPSRSRGMSLDDSAQWDPRWRTRKSGLRLKKVHCFSLLRDAWNVLK